MEIGPVEVLVIIVTLFIAGLTFRSFRGDRSAVSESKKDSTGIPEGHQATSGTDKVKKTGIALVAIGLVVLAFGMSTFELVTKMFMWAFVLVGGGLIILYLVRNR